MSRPAPRALLVLPDSAEARGLAHELAQAHVAVEQAHEDAAGLAALDAGRFDGLVTLLEARGIDGRGLVERACARHPGLCAIVLVDPGQDEGGREALRLGAADYEVRPASGAKLAALLERALRERGAASPAGEGVPGDTPADMVGASAVFASVLDRIRRLARGDEPVLIAGEPGSGRRRLARVLHAASSRARGPFVEATATEVAARAAAAAGGTLLVPELAPADAAAVLAARGAARLVATAAAPAAGAPPFALVEVPPLRDRADDLPLLADHFLRLANRAHGRRVTGLTRGALSHLAAHDWPGNVRELNATLEGMVVFAEGRRPLDVSDLPLRLRERMAPGGRTVTLSLDMSLNEMEKRFLEETLRAVGYDRARAAETLGIGLRTLYRKLKEYEIG